MSSEPQLAEVLDGRRRGRRSLAGDDVRALVARAPHDDRRLATGSVEVRLDDLEREPGRDGCVECVAAMLEDRHPGRGREPVRRGDHAECPGQLRPGRHRVFHRWRDSTKTPGVDREQPLAFPARRRSLPCFR